MSHITIAGRQIGPGNPVWIVAEIGANARTYYDAERLIIEAHEAGADAVKVQAIRPDGITLDCDNEHFQIKDGPWKGRTLWDLYEECAMPWLWFDGLKRVTEALGMTFFASVFCKESVDFCESLGMPAYKIASFELVDLPLIRYAASKGRPVILSTGMATKEEIKEALCLFRGRSSSEYDPVAVLHCVSAYPANPVDANLERIRADGEFFVMGLSDHTLGIAVPVAAVALGACIIEKHLCLDRSAGGPDSAFSLEPAEFKAMVDAVRVAEQAMGEVKYGATESERANLQFRRSLFVVADVRAGERYSPENVRSIRPASGLHPRFFDEVCGRRAARDVARGTPLGWEMVAK